MKKNAELKVFCSLPSVIEAAVEQEASSKRSYNVTNVLMASPKSEYKSSSLGRPPVTHDSCVNLQKVGLNLCV